MNFSCRMRATRMPERMRHPLAPVLPPRMPATSLSFVLLLLLLTMQRGRAESVNTEYMSHAPHRTDLPPECTQVYGLLERCRARVAARNFVQRAFNALGYGGCGGLEAKVVGCARHFRDDVVDAEPQSDRTQGQFSGDWARSELAQLHTPPRRSRKDGLTAEVFHKEYLSKGRPVIITDAAADWPALSWDYAKFTKVAKTIEWAELQPWNMAIDLQHVNSSAPLSLQRYHELLPEYPNLYLAWSNKLFHVGSLLSNKQYNYPYFLPQSLRKPSFEWVYMGAMAGPGAVGHIDILCQCSWALQIQGTKRWWLRSPLLESLGTQADKRVGGAGETFEFLQKPGEVFFFCPGWWHSTYVEDISDAGVATNPTGESSKREWKKVRNETVESLSLHAYVDLRPVGWSGDNAGTGALEQTDMLRTSVGGTLARTARGTEYAWALANSSSASMRDPTMLNQLVYSCGTEWGVSPPSVGAQFRAFVLSPECTALLVVAILTGRAAGWTANRYQRLRIQKEAELAAEKEAKAE